MLRKISYNSIKFDGTNYKECSALIKGWFYGGDVRVFLCKGGTLEDNTQYTQLQITYPVLSDSKLKEEITVDKDQTIYVLNYNGWPRVEARNE